MTRDWFDQQMARMTGLRFIPADLETHWEGLADVPEPVLEAAIGRAIRTRSEFPTPLELREDADLVAASLRQVAPVEDRSRDLPAPVTIGTLPTGTPVVQHREYVPYCRTCDDSGWMAVFVDGDGQGTVTRCACRDSNPELIRRRETQRRYAEARERRRA